jgi:hypothetical protein
MIVRVFALCATGLALLAAPGQASAFPARAQHPLHTDAVLAPTEHAGKGAAIHPAGSLKRSFTLPERSRQGPRSWFVMRLRARVIVRRTARPSLIYLTGSTNGRASVQVKLTVPPRSAPQQAIRWESYGLLDGLMQHASARAPLTIDARNYLQYKGVRPGHNTFTLGVEEFGGHALRSVRFLATTTIGAGYRSAASIRLAVDRASAHVAGDRLTVPVTVANHGGRAARHLAIMPDVDENLLQVERVSPSAIAKLAPGARRTAILRFRIRGAGRTTIAVAERDDVSGDHASITVDLPVTSRGSTKAQSVVGLLVPGSLFVSAAAFFLAPRRRRART